MLQSFFYFLEDFFNFFEEFFKLLEKMKTVLNPLRKAFRAVKNNKLTILDNYLVEKSLLEPFHASHCDTLSAAGCAPYRYRQFSPPLWH